jgi:hypothetical protein
VRPDDNARRGRNRSSTPLLPREKGIIYFEGGRAISPPRQLGNDPSSQNPFEDDKREKRDQKIKEAKRGPLRSRLRNVLLDMKVLEHRKKASHSDQAAKASKAGQVAPERETLPFEKLFTLFNRVFPSIELSLNDKNQIRAFQNGDNYSAEFLSDGEKQVFATIADILAHGAGENSYIVIDEPELNMHPHLAVRVWDVIEQDLPKSHFIYATHSIGFAMRSSVDRIYVLNSNEPGPKEINDVAELLREPEYEVEQFLGAIPSILSTPKALIVEGKDDSFDQPFYRWILGSDWIQSKNGLSIVSVEGSGNVKKALKREGVWRKLGADVLLAGVVDRDYKHDRQIDSYPETVHTLSFHEAECFLCHPKVVQAAAEKAGSDSPSWDEIADRIAAITKGRRLQIAARRVNVWFDRQFHVSLSREQMEEIGSEDDLRAKFRQRASTNREEADNYFSEESITKKLNEELDRIDTAVNDKDVDELLLLCPGKELLNGPITDLADSTSSEQLLRRCEMHLEIDNFEHLKTLRQKLKDKLSD